MKACIRLVLCHVSATDFLLDSPLNWMGQC